MRIAAFGATLLFAFAACSTTQKPVSESLFAQPNSLMAGEIDRRIEQIPFQHRDELLQNLLWLAQTGEQTIPALNRALQHESAKVRSSSAWVLGRLRDRRTIPNLQGVLQDEDPTVRLEVGRTLVLLGDLGPAPTLIEGLDSDRKEVRYMCHEALKTATGHDFGYDHLNENQRDLKLSVLRWRQWWGEYSGDARFAMSYQTANALDPQPAQPAGETSAMPAAPGTTPPQGNSAGTDTTGSTGPGTEAPPVPAPTPRPNGND
jgi:hypothetical protein